MSDIENSAKKYRPKHTGSNSTPLNQALDRPKCTGSEEVSDEERPQGDGAPKPNAVEESEQPCVPESGRAHLG